MFGLRLAGCWKYYLLIFTFSIFPNFKWLLLFYDYCLVIFHRLTKFHCSVAFTSWDIGQNAYCNFLLTRLWRHEFWKYHYLSNLAVFSTWPKSQDKNWNICRTKRFKKKIKSIFHHFSRAFSCQNFSQIWGSAFNYIFY